MLRRYDNAVSRDSRPKVKLPSFRAHFVYNFVSLNSWASVVWSPIEQQVVFSRSQRAIALGMTVVMVMACLAIVHIAEGAPDISNVEPASVKELVQQRLALSALNTLLLFPVRQVLRQGIILVHDKRSCTEHDLKVSRSTILRLRHQEYQCIRSVRWDTFCKYYCY